MTYTKEQPREIKLADLRPGTLLWRFAEATLRYRPAYYVMRDGVPTKITL